MSGEVGIVVITRFAVDTGSGRGPYADDVWLESRFDLFERFCAPGMAAQTNRPLAWLLLMDHTTPKWVDERLSKAAPGSTTVRLDGPWSAERVTATLATLGLGGLPSMGVDSDDILLPDCLERMSASVARHGDGIHSIPVGLQLDKSGLYRRFYLQNPFLCFVDANSARHVFDLSHWDVRGERLHLVDWRAGWVQVIHNSNLANEVRGIYQRGISARRVLASMGITLEVPPARRLTAAGRTVSSSARYIGAMVRRVPALLRLAADAAKRSLS